MNCLNLQKFLNKKIILEEYLKGQQLSTESTYLIIMLKQLVYLIEIMSF